MGACHAAKPEAYTSGIRQSLLRPGVPSVAVFALNDTSPQGTGCGPAGYRYGWIAMPAIALLCEYRHAVSLSLRSIWTPSLRAKGHPVITERFSFEA